MKVVGILALVNVAVTAVLFYFTMDPGEPFIAPLSQTSVLLRLAVISAVIGFLEILALMGWRRGARD